MAGGTWLRGDWSPLRIGGDEDEVLVLNPFVDEELKLRRRPTPLLLDELVFIPELQEVTNTVLELWGGVKGWSETVQIDPNLPWAEVRTIGNSWCIANTGVWHWRSSMARGAIQTTGRQMWHRQKINNSIFLHVFFYISLQTKVRKLTLVSP